MEFYQKIDGLEDQLAESRKRLESLTSMVQNLTDKRMSDIKAGPNGSDILKRLESKLDVIAETSSVDYIESFLANLREELTEKQNFINSKTAFLEGLAGQITDLLKNQSVNSQSENQLLLKGLDALKIEIDNLFSNLNSISDSINNTNSRILEFSSDIQHTNNALSNLDNKNDLEFLKSAVGAIDLSVNATISGLSILDSKVKTILDNFEQITSAGNLDSVKDDLKLIAEKFNALFEVLNITSTVNDIEEVKDEINIVGSKFGEFQNHLDSSIVQLKDNVKDLLNTNNQEEIKKNLDNNTTKVSKEFEIVKNNIESVNTKIVELQSDVTSSVSQFKEKLSLALEVLQISSTSSDIEEVKSEINSVRSSLLDNVTNISNLNIEIAEVKNLISELFLKDDTGPVIGALEQLHTGLNKLEENSKNKLEAKLTKIHDELCLSQDKFNISISNLVRPVGDNIIQLNEKIADIKEYLKLRIKDEVDSEEKLAVIVERFNDIWTSAGLTIDKLADQIAIAEDSTNKFQTTVKDFFETSEDTNLIITNLLKKTADIDNNLNKISDNLENQVENLSHKFDVEHQKMQNTLVQSSTNINNNLSSLLETDLNFLRSDIIEFKDKQEKILEDSITNQESIQNSLSNLHFTITDSAESISKRINDLAGILDKLNNSSADNLYTSNVIKESLMQIAQWVDGAENLLTETNSCVKDIKKSNEIKRVLTELASLKEILVKNSHLDISGKIENDLLSTKNEIKSSINAIKKRQENDFNNINTSISGISQEIFNISHSFTAFENKLRQDFKTLGQIISEKNKTMPSVSPDQLEINLNKVRQDINLELRRISDKFNNLETNLENIEEKINSLEMRQSMDGNNQEIKQLLESISAQMNSQNENGKGTALLFKKITVMEKKIAEFDTSLKKIVNFIEAE